jgi:hypothetical protein
MIRVLIIVCLIVAIIAAQQQHHRKRALPDDFEVAVLLRPSADADVVAKRYGYINQGQIGALERHFEFLWRDGKQLETHAQHVATALSTLGKPINLFICSAVAVFSFL